MSTSTATIPVKSAFAGTASNKDKGDYEAPPPGSHPVVLIALIDLGTHRSTFQNEKGEFPDIRQYLYVWELTAESQKDGQNFIVGQSYNSSLHKKSGHRIMIEGWLSRSFQDSEEFDPSTLLGRQGLATLVEEKAKDGSPFVKLKSVGPPPRGLTVPEASRPTVMFHLSQLGGFQKTLTPDLVPAWLPKVYGKDPVDEIKSSHEYLAMTPF